jgi:hypothetical protein
MPEKLKKIDREFVEAAPYFAVGAAQGLWRYYKPELALGAIVGSALAYDFLCEPGGTLSEAVDGLIDKHPLGTRAVIGVTALHLANIIPPRIDPFYQAFKHLKRQ